MTADVLTGATSDTDGPPDYDADEVRVLASRADLRSLELVELTFNDIDSIELFDPRGFNEDTESSIGLFVSWSLDPERSLFSCLVTTDFSVKILERGERAGERADETAERSDEAWAQCVFRVVYSVGEGDTPVTSSQANQFAHWNVPFNVWPYFREIAANMFQRTRHTPMLVPLFRMPR